MTVAERTTELLAHGAALQLYLPGEKPMQVLLAALRWDMDPGAFRWCGVNPSDQHHVHATPYTKAELATGGRDIVVYGPGGALLAVVCPYEETRFEDENPREVLEQWRAKLAAGENQRYFEEFFADAI